MSQGKEYKIKVSPTGVTNTGLLEIPMQGDLTINPGKSIQTTRYKNGQVSAQQDAGFTCSFEMGNVSPLSAAETRIWALNDSGELAFFEIENSVTGGIEWSFTGRVAIQSMGTPVSGPTSISVQVGADGTPTRSVAA